MEEDLQRESLATNPFLPPPAADNDEARQEDLTVLLQAHEAPGSEEQRIVTRIAGAVREWSEAKAEAKAKSAAAEKTWPDQDGHGKSPIVELSDTVA